MKPKPKPKPIKTRKPKPATVLPEVDVLHALPTQLSDEKTEIAGERVELLSTETEPSEARRQTDDPVAPSQSIDADVRALLFESYACHKRAMAPSRSQRRNTWWLTDLRAAAKARIHAERRDPGFTSPEWRGEAGLTPTHVNTHDAMMAFYRAKGVI